MNGIGLAGSVEIIKQPVHAIDFTVWAVNGGPLPDEVISKIEEGLERILLELSNEGHRLLTQTSYGREN